MSCKNGTEYIGEKCSESHNNKLDAFIKDCQGGIATLTKRQFNCPSCIKSEKSSCQIPSWVKPPCDGMKCFNCPPKYLCFDASYCHSGRKGCFHEFHECTPVFDFEMI